MFKKITFALIATLISISTFGETYYIAKDGDNTDGLSWPTAWTDLQAKVQSVNSNLNNTFNIGAGTWQMTNLVLYIPKNTYLKGTNRETVIFSAAPTNRVCYIGGSNVCIDSVTLTGGNELLSWGGAVGVWNVAALNLATITNCIISQNSAKKGGGVYYITVFNSILISNISTEISATLYEDGGGAGIYCNFYNCEFLYNKANTCGGAVAGRNGYTTASNCVFMYNTASNYGGAAHNQFKIYNSIIVSNTAAYGGAFGSKNLTTPYNYIYNSEIKHNMALVKGGVAGSHNQYTIIYNSIIASNRAPKGGVATDVGYTFTYGCILNGNTAQTNDISMGKIWMYNCTILNHTNSATPLCAYYSSYVAIYNNIFWNNSNNMVAGILLNNWAGTESTSPNWNPIFVAGTYKLASNSPCIGKADTNYVYTEVDFYGRPRTNAQGKVSLGAIEWYEGDD